MPKVNKPIARTDIYERALRTPDTSLKQGYSLDRSKPADATDKILVKKGEKYYWWQFKNGPKNISLTPPKPAQLTQSAFMQSVYSIQENMDALCGDDMDELESNVESIKSEAEDLRDQTQESLDNMPEGLQQGDTGQLLQERIDALEEFIGELENIEYEDIDESEFKKDWVSENCDEGYEYVNGEIIHSGDESEESASAIEEYNTDMEKAYKGALSEKIEELISEIQQICINI